ncbi:protein DEK-like [Panicum miliaceum]|uniref:Protein DEK-like n=1 Tax=Panicum miliaceum TaxID=4540 RepID=A0A3L6SJL7_PANMI|nr:protein DEK-like [Panicum miliaceum]
MASEDAKPASSPAAADPPAGDAEDAADPEPAAPAEGKEESTPQQPEKKRGRRKKGEAQAEAVKKTPPPRKSGPAAERPSRERKTVERYSELAPRVMPVKKSPAILQGSGTKLKDIPNVSFKLSKRKADENLQSLHVLMYGKKSNVHFLKRNISQFSGFVWMDNQEKHRAKIKEKLDKFNKEKLLDFCEILDIYVAKATTKKEEVSAKVLEFLESPFVTRDVVLTDNKKGKKRGRRPKGSGEAASEGASAEKKRKRSKNQAAEAGKENDDEEDADPAGSEDASTGEEGDEESEANDHAVSDDEPDEPPAKKKSTDVHQVKKETGSNAKEKDAPRKRVSTKPAKGASKPSQDIKDEPDIEVKKAGKRAKSSKETDAPQDSNKVNKVSKSKKDDGKESQNNNVAKPSSKNKGKGKGGAEAKPVPTIEQLHAVVTRILKEVDFNTATLADILRQLGTHFEMDLMDRKAEVKCIIEDVINNMSDDDGGEEDSEDEAGDSGKEEKAKGDSDGGEEK